MIIYKYDSPVGTLRISVEDGKIAELKTGDGDVPAEGEIKGWLDAYFLGDDPGKIALAPQGTEYQKRVWGLLEAISYGTTTNYKAVAEAYECAYGEKTSPRAVGGAVGKNPIWIIVPCHRVIGADGGLTGYAGGLKMKKKLLELEGVSLT